MGRLHVSALLALSILGVACHKSSDDSAQDVGVGLLCGQLLGCDQKCGSARDCTDACYRQATAHAEALFNAFDQCLNANCSSASGGPCADPSSSTCSSCNQSAATGACIGGLANCENDDQAGPPNASGDAGDAGGGGTDLACGALVACVANCPHGDGGTEDSVTYENCTSVCKYNGTPQGIALYGLLQDCLNKACPNTPGGICEHMNEACAGCQEQAVFAMPNVCADPWTTCQNDRSDTGDASTTPTVLVDGGTLQTLVTGIVQAASELQVKDGYLYFAEVTGDAPILRLSLADGGTATLPDASNLTTFGVGTQTPAGIRVDSKNIYVWSYGTFTGKTSLNNNDGTVFQIPLDGSPTLQLDKGMETFYDAPYLNSVTIDAKNVYWIKGAVASDGMVMKTAIGSTTPTVLYSNQQIPEAIATDGVNVYWADWGTFDATGASNNDATIWQGSIDGGTPIQLASNQQAPSCIVVDSTNVYWNNLGKLGADLFPATNSGSIMQVKIGGGTVVTVASFQAIPTGLAVGNGNIYWTDYGLSVAGVLMSIPIGGSAPVPLVGGLNDPFSLTIAGSTLYWTNTPSSNGHGTIMSFTP